MTRTFVILASTLLLSNIVWAQSAVQLTDTNSLSKAVLEIAARDYKGPHINHTVVAPYTAAQLTDTNSLSKAVLEIAARDYKGPHINSTVAAPYTNDSEKNNSLARAALAKQEAMVSSVFNVTD